MNILIVEDEISVAGVIKENIEAFGYSVEIANTGRDALKKVKRKRFELMLLDIYLPDCMGHELIPKFKEARPDMGIITITGYNSRELELEVRQKGIIFYMVKPFNLTEMKEILSYYSKKREKETKE